MTYSNRPGFDAPIFLKKNSGIKIRTIHHVGEGRTSMSHSTSGFPASQKSPDAYITHEHVNS